MAPDPTPHTVTTPAVVISGLSHTYPKSPRPALADVSLDVALGEAVAILGPNGSGKTTLFRLLCTLLPPQVGRGRVHLFGHDLVAEPVAVRRQLGVVFQNPSLDGKLTAEENLTHAGRLYGLAGAALRERVAGGLAQFGLADRRHELVDTFSGGMRRRLELAKAMLHEPRLLLLDEPSTGLDPAVRRELWRHVDALRARLGLTVVLTTHLMDEAERCERVAIFAQGRLVAIDTPDALKARVGGDVVTLATGDGDAHELSRLVAQRFGPFRSGPLVVDGEVRLEPADADTLAREARRLWPERVRSVTVGQPTLEDAYLHLTGARLDLNT